MVSVRRLWVVVIVGSVLWVWLVVIVVLVRWVVDIGRYSPLLSLLWLLQWLY